MYIVEQEHELNGANVFSISQLIFEHSMKKKTVQTFHRKTDRQTIGQKNDKSANIRKFSM